MGQFQAKQQVAAQIGEDGIFKENEIATQLVAQIGEEPIFRENEILQQVVAQIKKGVNSEVSPLSS